MKINVKVYALSYASKESDEGKVFVDTLGIFDNYQDAVDAMNSNVSQDIEDGDDEDKWEVEGNQANYVDDFSCTYKSYSVKGL